jgi:KDO2-lipid IV(A) lauroyltransferase
MCPANVTDVSNSKTTLKQKEFLKPVYWPTWLGIGLIRLICLLPLRARWHLGGWLGKLGYLLAVRRRHIVTTNLSICFPEKTASEINTMVVDNFISSGISIIETALVWFTPASDYLDIVDIKGLDHLTEAANKGQGVILLGMHLSTLDFCGAVLGCHHPFDVMYRKNKNKLLEAVMTQGRERHFYAAIERDNVRQVIRRLREGATVWYGPDQDYGRKHSVFAPFFNQQAATITATSRIAGITKSPVVVFSHYRDLDSGRYTINLSEPLAAFPGESPLEDCTRVNRIIEDAIRVHPEQYWWLHRRFKTRPNDEPRPYDIVG